jgi:hypothetical protein
MPSRQKNKGNNFERVVAKHLSNVFGYNFERVPTSGAMTGGINEHVLDRLSRSQKLLLEGDLIPPDEMYNIKIECKTLKSINFSSFLNSNKTLDDWIDQAKSPDKVWFLIFKINNRGSFVCMSKVAFQFFKESHNSNRIIYKDCVIVSMDGFFENNKDNIFEIAK